MDQSPLRNLEFWVAVAVALIVKIRTSAQLGWGAVLVTVIVAVGAAWVATGWAAALTGLPYPVAAALVTLTAEGAMRWLLIAVADPKAIIDIWKYWRKP